MKIEPSPSRPGYVQIDCLDCGKLFDVHDWRRTKFRPIAQEFYEKSRRCPECEAKRATIRAARQEQIEKERYLVMLPETIARCGIPSEYYIDRESGKPFKVPPVAFVGRWVWTHRNENFLLSGVTGSGKSTSCCTVASIMVANRARVRYATLRELLSDWREAKTCDRAAAPEELLARLYKLDVLIIDEVVGKYRVTDSGQELLFELLEAINSGDCRAKVWLLGNFFAGSIEGIFADADPVRRRLQEQFSCVRIDRKNELIAPLKVWNEALK